MARTFKALSALLTYPTPEIVQAAPAALDVLREEKLLSPGQIESLRPLVDEIGKSDLYDLQERYLLLFDRTRSLSLHLFEHVHGESRDRGQAMVDLKAVYDAAGLEMSTGDLPDYLPLFLEFLATRPLREALDLVAEPAHILAALAERLRKRSSVYAPVMDVLADLADADPSAAEVRQLVAEPDIDPNDLEALDAAWMDEEVRFGPTAADACGSGSLMPKLRQARRPAPGLETGPRPRPATVITHSGSRIS